MRTYSHSGTVPLAGAVWTLLAGLAAAFFGGFIYAYGFYWIAVGFLRVVMALLFGGAIGMTVAQFARSGKIRSPLFVMVLAIVCTLAGLWIYWGAYDWARRGPVAGVSAWSPAGLAAQAQDLFDNGSWKLRRRTITGWPLVAFWVVEAGVILWVSVSSAGADARRPFCESCQEWTTETKGLMQFEATGTEPAWKEVLGGELPAIAEFPLADGTKPETVRLDLATCPKCEHSSFVTLTAVKVTTDKKGKTKTTERTLISCGALSPSEAEFLRRFAQEQPGTSPFAENQAPEADDAELS